MRRFKSKISFFSTSPLPQTVLSTGLLSTLLGIMSSFPENPTWAALHGFNGPSSSQAIMKAPHPRPTSSPSPHPEPSPSILPSPSASNTGTQNTDKITTSAAAPRASGPRTPLDRLEASVNSSLILLSDVKKFREVIKLRSQLDPLFNGTPVASHGSQASTSEIVDFLIDERIITQQYPKSDAEVEQEVNSIQNNNHLDRATLKEALTHEGFKFADYFELIRDSGSKRDLIDRDIRTKVTISDDDIKNYFYNHYSKSATTPRAFHIQIISVSEKSFKAPTKTAAQSLANKAVMQALKDVRGGESFEEVAKRISDDSSASAGGDLGVMTEDQMSPIIRNQVKKLQIGQVSEIFGANSGRYQILKLLDVKSSDSDRLDKMKEEIRNQLASGEYQHQISLWLERQRQANFIHKAGEPSMKTATTTQ